MPRLRGSIATRLAVGYGLLAVLALGLMALVFHVGTIGVIRLSTDAAITSISQRLAEAYRDRPLEDLMREIDQQLLDGTDSDSEVFVVLSPTGERIAGNVSSWPAQAFERNTLLQTELVRAGVPIAVRFMIRERTDGLMIVVGRDLREQEAVDRLVLRALWAGATLALLLTVGGATLFRRQIEARVGTIRHATRDVGRGDMSRRVPVGGDDEFSRLGVDINGMLDRIEHLMEGVRDVSNAIAHDLRTPLTRIRNRLEEVARRDAPPQELHAAIGAATAGIDDLITLFDKLLQIAEIESGVLARSFRPVDPAAIARDMVELYDATAEQQGVALQLRAAEVPPTLGDHDLLASALASLIDNAIKYAGRGATVEVVVAADARSVWLEVRDDGPGILAEDRPRVTERFYRGDRSRGLPGNGLGLSIVAAIVALHEGRLSLEDARPGLRAIVTLPLCRPSQLSDR